MFKLLVAGASPAHGAQDRAAANAEGSGPAAAAAAAAAAGTELAGAASALPVIWYAA